MRLSASPEIAGLMKLSLETNYRQWPGSAFYCLDLWIIYAFHHFAGLLGKKNIDLLADVVAKHEWVCFPAGAQNKRFAKRHRYQAKWGGLIWSGSRYADWAGVVFKDTDQEPKFAADLRLPGVEIEQLAGNELGLRQPIAFLYECDCPVKISGSYYTDMRHFNPLPKCPSSL